ncbi:hypothetical protein [Photobacterium kishitanii]|uniref:hypothetical protein n=1 Tax=Photobacterium kishitanii TaxID=318456 RepID=UPI00071AED0B|nr:hypothetical protein [Photobacterium kishitanii]
MNKTKIILFSLALLPTLSQAQTPQGNTTNPSFSKAKKIMQIQGNVNPILASRCQNILKKE